MNSAASSRNTSHTSRSPRARHKASPAKTRADDLEPDTSTHSIGVLHSRAEHGSRRIHILRMGDGEVVYQVGPPGEVAVYTSRTALLKAVCGKDPGISFERYFKLDQQDDVGPLSTLDLFGPGDEDIPNFTVPKKRESPAKRHRPNPFVGRWAPRVLMFSTIALFACEGLDADALADIPAVIHITEPAPEPQIEDHEAVLAILEDQASGQMADPQTADGAEEALGITEITLGIDLANKSEDVRRLLFAGFGRRIAARGYEPEDVLQDVYRGILARNYGKCPWDYRKSSFGHYVHMVCGCVFSNYDRRELRRRQFEQVGMRALDPDEGGMSHQDACLVAERTLDGNEVAHGGAVTAPDENLGTEMAAASLADFLAAQKQDQDTRLAIKALPYVQQGYARGEIARDMGLEPTKVGRALARLRRGAEAWKATIA